MPRRSLAVGEKHCGIKLSAILIWRIQEWAKSDKRNGVARKWPVGHDSLWAENCLQHAIHVVFSTKMTTLHAVIANAPKFIVSLYRPKTSNCLGVRDTLEPPLGCWYWTFIFTVMCGPSFANFLSRHWSAHESSNAGFVYVCSTVAKKKSAST
jgi:hypothetical protein